MTAQIEQVGGSQTRRAGAHYGHPLAGAVGGRAGLQKPRAVPVLDDGVLVFLDGDGIAGGHAAGAGGLAQGGADPAGELRKTVGGGQAAQSQLPAALADQIVPLGDEVVQRATAGHAADHHAALAEGDAAVHAAGALDLLFVTMQRDMKFVEIGNAFFGRQLGAGLPRILHKACGCSHDTAASFTVRSSSRRMLRFGPARCPRPSLPSGR